MFNMSLRSPYSGLFNTVMTISKHGEIASRIEEIAKAYGLPQRVIVCAASVSTGRATVLLTNYGVALVHFNLIDGKVVIDCEKSVSDLLNTITTNVNRIGFKK